MLNLDELEKATTEWADARGIIRNGKLVTQVAKLFEESGELAGAILKNKDKEIKDSIGDSIVVLNNIAKIYGTTLEECWNLAYEEIKDRKGYLNEEGNFIKEADMQEVIKAEKIISNTDFMYDTRPFTITISITYDDKTSEILTIWSTILSPIEVPRGKYLTLSQYKEVLTGLFYEFI